MEKEGIIARKRLKDAGVWTYHLTSAGKDLIPIVKALGVWGQHWGRRELADNEINLGLMIWEMERGVRPKVFGNQRTVVQLVLTDQPEGKRTWWFVNEKGELDLCLNDPGYEVDLYLATTLPDMIRIWRGDLSLSNALSSGRFEAHGPTGLRRSLRTWLKLSPFSPYRARSAAAQLRT